MKKLLSIAIISIFILSSASSQAGVLTAEEVKEKITPMIVQNAQKYTDAELNAKVIAIPFKSVQIPEGEVTYTITSAVDRFVPRDLSKVVINVKGQPFRTFNAPVEIKAYKEVLVATEYIDRERTLSANCVSRKKLEVSTNLDYIVSPELIGQEIITKKPFKTGEIIDKRFVKIKPDVTRNSNITAIFRQNNLSISIDATALSDGMRGDYIEVLNSAYKKTYTGKVIGENRVLIEM